MSFPLAHIRAALVAVLAALVVPACALAASATDPYVSSAWQLQGDQPMGVASAWDQTTGGNVVVAIVDTGIDLTHPDLRDNLWTNPGEIPGNGIDDDHDGFVDDVHGADFVNRDGVPTDDNGHGTHVAGIVGARGDNGVGTAGVAWRVQLMAVKVLDANASGDARVVAQGVRYAVDHGARIINLSLAGPSLASDLEDAIAYAGAHGVLVVCAAGNDGLNLGVTPSYPASLPEANLIGVGATNERGLLSAISDFGNGVDIAAPGEDIVSTAKGGGYELRTGTSMAAPMVTGAAALLEAADPGADATALSAALLGGARRSLLPVGAGTLDVAGALRRVIPAGAWRAGSAADGTTTVPLATLTGSPSATTATTTSAAKKPAAKKKKAKKKRSAKKKRKKKARKKKAAKTATARTAREPVVIYRAA